MRIENEHIFDHSLKSGVNLFLGSGFSILAKNEKGFNLPIGDELKNELNQYFYNRNSTSLSLSQLVTNIKGKWRSDFYDYLMSRFFISSFSEIYNSLKKVNIKNIYTTNIDNLVQEIYKTDMDKYINPVFLNGPLFEKDKIDFYQLHGTIYQIESCKFDVFEVTSSFNTESSKWTSLVSGLTEQPNIFIGYSFNDANTIQAFKLALETKNLKASWILLQEEDDELIEYFHNMNIQVIIGDIEELLTYFDALKYESTKKTFVNLDSFVPEYLIPLKSSVVSRGFEEFVLGSDPIWSDIYNPAIIKLHYYQEIMDKVVGGKNILMLGPIASGKSTLLMQLAASYNLNQKLYINSMSYEKAQFLLRIIDKNKVTIFLDNCCTDYRIIDLYNKTKNIQIVAADRDFQYESISQHFIDFSKIFIDNITDTDIQNIYDSIPAHMRSSRIVYYGDRKVSERESVFEIMQYNINKRSFKERIKKLASDIVSDPISAKILTMISYLQSNNSILNMDILVCMLSDESGISYDEIQGILKKISGMIIEIGINHSLVESNQDHFISRSRIFAEEFISNIDSRILREAIILIIEKYNSYIIPNLKVFKRTAFDSDLFNRVFYDYHEGEDYYNWLYEIDNSPYTLQHCALYLSKKHQHRKAFEYIERAKNIQKYVNWTIKNTYAILLFNTNINKENTDDVYDILKQSMDSLIECYANDNRKYYHAKVFSKNVLELSRRGILVDVIDEYKDKAKTWLREEIKINPWRNEVKVLLQELMI